jgi:hypothetical protein
MGTKVELGAEGAAAGADGSLGKRSGAPGALGALIVVIGVDGKAAEVDGATGEFVGDAATGTTGERGANVGGNDARGAIVGDVATGAVGAKGGDSTTGAFVEAVADVTGGAIGKPVVVVGVKGAAAGTSGTWVVMEGAVPNGAAAGVGSEEADGPTGAIVKDVAEGTESATGKPDVVVGANGAEPAADGDRAAIAGTVVDVEVEGTDGAIGAMLGAVAEGSIGELVVAVGG